MLVCGGLALAGCGTSSTKASGAANPTSPSTGSVATTVDIRSTTLGQVLTTVNGRVLYLLTADRPGSRSCSGACLQYWPPVMVHGAPVAAPGVTARLGQLAVSGGQQLTVNGLPAYTYSGDTSAGQTSGQGIGSFGGVWWVLSTTGAPITNSGRATAPTTSSSSYGGY